MYMVIDCETTGLDVQTCALHGVGIAYGQKGEKPKTGYLTPEEFRNSAFFNVQGWNIIGHNLRFDLKFLTHQLGWKPWESNTLWDTRRMAHKIDENSPCGLKELTPRYLGADRLEGKNEIDIAVEVLGGDSVADLCLVDLAEHRVVYQDLIATYCIEDVVNTWDLFWVLGEKLKQLEENIKKAGLGEKGPLSYIVERAMPLEPVLLDMELRGIRVDAARVGDVKSEAELQQRNTIHQLASLCRDEVAVMERKYAKSYYKPVKGVPQSFNWASPKQVAKLFFEEIGLPNGMAAPRTKKGEYGTQEPVLRAIQQQLPNGAKLKEALGLYLDYKGTLKTSNTYTGSEESGLLSNTYTMPDGTRRVYPQYGTFLVTDRLSSNSPNIQNQPREGLVRSFFIPDSPNHVFGYGDYKQLELRIAAHLAQDRAMMNTFWDMEQDPELDPHTMLAAELFNISPSKVTKEQRQVGKRANFLFIYNGSEWRFQSAIYEEAGLQFHIDECKAIRDRFFEKRPDYYTYLQRQLEKMMRYKVVVSETGCVRRLPELAYGEWVDRRRRAFVGPVEVREQLVEGIIKEKADAYMRSRGAVIPEQWAASEGEVYQAAWRIYKHALNQGFNYPIQHLGAVMCKEALISLHREGFPLVNQVHDSIISQLSRAEAVQMLDRQRRVMESSYQLSIPVRCDMKLLTSMSEADKLQLEAKAA